MRNKESVEIEQDIMTLKENKFKNIDIVDRVARIKNLSLVDASQLVEAVINGNTFNALTTKGEQIRYVPPKVKRL